ncbi:MAG: sulfite exporter TauE/SafE family protein, partial [Candidatus Omnitrophica bacterium]|nr:sulfite exporter TauE/SafE family protein [Candidatus Omnitrophota bacterium]
TAGVVVGYLAMGKISDQQLKPLIGTIVLAMLAINYWQNKKSEQSIPTGRWFAAAMGLAAGITTMMANAAGPVLVIYLLAMRLPKIEFVGTAAWYFFLLNWFKVPFSTSLGFINRESLMLNLLVLPAIALGAVLGIVVLNRLPEKIFTATVQSLAALAAIKLIF